jgi:hypothetical protein
MTNNILNIDTLGFHPKTFYYGALFEHFQPNLTFPSLSKWRFGRLLLKNKDFVGVKRTSLVWCCLNAAKKSFFNMSAKQFCPNFFCFNGKN